MKLEQDPRLPLAGSVQSLTTRLTALFRQVMSAVNGHDDGYTHACVSVSAAYTVQRGDGAVMVNASGGARTVTLQQPAEAKGKTMFFRKTEGSANNVTLTPPSGLIDGAASLALTAASPRATLISDGTNYYSV